MTNLELVNKVKDIATNYKTKYMWGTFGSIITERLIQQKMSQYPSRYPSSRQSELRKEIDKNCWAFDCVGLIKGILWGWVGDSSKTYGGATYQANNVPDTTASGIINSCSGVSTNFSSIEKGEAVYMEGHIGIYIGDGKVVECTIDNSYDGCVVTNLSGRGWIKHGKMPWVTYVKEEVSAPTTTPIGGEFKLNDIVNFKGGYHYGSSSATDAAGGKRTAGKAKVTNTAKGAAHPYHLIGESGGSNVYGWVNASDIEGATTEAKTIKVGSKVKVKSGAKIYGKASKFASFVYNDTWIVSEIKGSRAVIDKNVSGSNSICSPVSINDLILI